MGRNILDLDKRDVLINLEKGQIEVTGNRVYLQIGNETFIVPTKEYFSTNEQADKYRKNSIAYAIKKYSKNFDKILFMQSWPSMYPQSPQKLENFVNILLEDQNTPISIIYSKQIQDIVALRYHTINKYNNGYFVVVSPIYEFISPDFGAIYLNFQEIPQILDTSNESKIVKTIKEYARKNLR